MKLISEQQLQNVINCIAAANHATFPFQQVHLLLQELAKLPEAKVEEKEQGVAQC